ncbi:MAG: PAS domain-containing protein [Deltaproteobacteria bacterium]|nr:PAS domain-containing protein [Deltaproteobacteria bacterium]
MTDYEKLLTGKESPFEVEQIIYSVTDRTGKIIDINQVFQHVSKYDPNELLGSPHSLLRHPKMPRGVFKLMWDTILANKRFGGYVVNRAKNGDHYWVFACVVPIKDKFISFRIKPMFKTVFERIQKVYELVLEEEAKAQKPTEQANLSFSALVSHIEKLGFANYEKFWKWVFLNEFLQRLNHYNLTSAINLIQDRGKAVQLEYLNRVFLEFKNPLSRLVEAYERSLNLEGLGKALKQVSLNLSIRAKKIGDTGTTLDCISTELRRFSDYLELSTSGVKDQVSELIEQFFDFATWLLCNLLVEEANLWRGYQNDKDSVSTTNGASNLALSDVDQLVTETLDRILATGLEFKIDELSSVADRFLRFEKNLNFITVSGRVESSRLEESESFWALLAQVEEQAHFLNKLAYDLSQLGITLKQLVFMVLCNSKNSQSKEPHNALQVG